MAARLVAGLSGPLGYEASVTKDLGGSELPVAGVTPKSRADRGDASPSTQVVELRLLPRALIISTAQSEE